MVRHLILTQKTMVRFHYRLLCTCLMDRNWSPKPVTRVRFLPGVLRLGEKANAGSFELFIRGFESRRRRQNIHIMQQKSRDSPASFLLDYKVVFFFQLWFSFAFPYCKTWRILAVWTCAKNVGVPHVLDHDAHSKGNIFRIFPFTPPNEGTDTALCCSVRNGVRNIIVKQGRYFAVFQHFRISFNFSFHSSNVLKFLSFAFSSLFFSVSRSFLITSGLEISY